MVEYAFLLVATAMPIVGALVFVGKQMSRDYSAAQTAILSAKP